VNPQFATLIVESAAATFAVGRLVHFRLVHRFPALLGFLIFLALFTGLFAIVSHRTPAYFWMYVFYVLLRNVLSIVTVWELFALVFDDYPGIQTVGRWAMYAGIVLSVAASVAVARIFWQGGAGNRDAFLFYLEVLQRSVVFSLALVIATMLFVLSRYPLHLSRNTYLSSLFFSLLFLSDAARLLIDSLSPGLYNHYVDWSADAVIAALLGFWAVLLRPEPQADIPRVSPSGSEETHLLEQLDSLNAFLDSASHR
jgi:hypothetical protein